MKIDRIETFFVLPRWLFVRVEAQGAIGARRCHDAPIRGESARIDRVLVAFEHERPFAPRLRFDRDRGTQGSRTFLGRGSAGRRGDEP